jgi:serpin B
MVAAGSKDANLKAFGQALNFDVKPSDPSTLSERLDQVIQLDSYSKGNTAVDFSSASSIWHRADFILNAPWVSIIQNQFHATIGPLELTAMNAFIENETKGKFKDLIKPADLVGAVLYLVSCLHFKARWANPFDSVRTEQKADFFTWNGKTETVKMMNKIDQMEYVEDEEIQVCILPYKTDDNPDGPKWKAAIILPKRKGLPAMQDILIRFAASPETLHSLLTGSSREVQVSQAPPPTPQGSGGSSSSSGIPSSLGNSVSTSRPQPSSSRSTAQTRTHPLPRPRRSQKINFSFPCFSLKLNVDLIPHLKKLGLGPVFTTSDDFAPISNGPLRINRVTHDLFLEVDEEGTEMAAVTIVGMR